MEKTTDKMLKYCNNCWWEITYIPISWNPSSGEEDKRKISCNECESMAVWGCLFYWIWGVSLIAIILIIFFDFK